MTIQKINKELDYYEKLQALNYNEERKRFFKAVENGVEYNPQFRYRDDNNLEKYLALKRIISNFRGEDPLINEYINIFEKVTDLMISWQKDNYEEITEISGDLFGSYKDLDYKKVLAVYQALDSKYFNQPLRLYKGKKVYKEFERALNKEGLDGWTIEFNEAMPGGVAIYELDKKIFLKKTVTYNEIKLSQTIAHEIKGHAYQAFNAELPHNQKYRDWLIGYLGTEKQYEGLAIFTEINHQKEKYIAATLHFYILMLLANIKAVNSTFFEIFSWLSQYTEDSDIAYNMTIRTKRGFRDTSKRGCFQKENAYIFGCYEIAKLVKTDIKNYNKIIQGIFPLSVIEYIKDTEVKWVGIEELNWQGIEFFIKYFEEILNN
jgi:hypothetical protein